MIVKFFNNADKQKTPHVFKDTFSQIWLLQWKVENLFEGFTNKNVELFFPL